MILMFLIISKNNNKLIYYNKGHYIMKVWFYVQIKKKPKKNIDKNDGLHKILLNNSLNNFF